MIGKLVVLIPLLVHVESGAALATEIDEPDIVVTVNLSTNAVPERCPFVATITMENRGQADVGTILDINSPMDLQAAAVLMLHASDGKKYPIHYTGTPSANVFRLTPGRTVTPGMRVTFDRVFLPVFWGQANERGRYQYAYVEPGEYVGWITVNYDTGLSARSEEFTLKIVPLSGESGLLVLSQA